MLRPALAADFGFIRTLVQRPEYSAYLTDEDEQSLAQYAAGPSTRVLIWQNPQGLAAGFALFCDIGAASGAVELRRLALAETGTGQGAVFLNALIDYGFTNLGAQRLWLDASGENLRAQRVYTRAGFTLEGRLRQHWYRPSLGRTVDLMLYGMMRYERHPVAPPCGPPALALHLAQDQLGARDGG